MEPHGLERLRRRDLQAASDLCARAFLNAPHVVRFFPDASRRRRDAVALFRMRIGYGLRFGEVHVTAPDPVGIAVWLPSEAASMTTWREVLAGGIGLYRAVGADAIARMTQVSRHNEQLRREHAREPYWFLSILAVAPDHQGHGHGAALVRPTLARLDRDRASCYAETTDRSVLPFYERLGFRVGAESAVPGIDLTVFPLVRPPAPG